MSVHGDRDPNLVDPFRYDHGAVQEARNSRRGCPVRFLDSLTPPLSVRAGVWERLIRLALHLLDRYVLSSGGTMHIPTSLRQVDSRRDLDGPIYDAWFDLRLGEGGAS